MREVTYRTKPTSTEDGKLVFTYDNAVVRKYSWGLDLSGQSGDARPAGIHGAGGIGGLLAAVETSGTHAGSYWYLYDANGNVGQVLNATDPQSITPAAHYEYDPYGNRVAKSGSYADYNPFRFSTKWRDDEAGLYYYGYRYYSPALGRWISRDPIEEDGGVNLSAFVANNAACAIDVLGLMGYIDPGWIFPPQRKCEVVILGGTGQFGDWLDCMGQCLEDEKAAQCALAAGLGGLTLEWPVTKTGIPPYCGNNRVISKLLGPVIEALRGRGGAANAAGRKLTCCLKASRGTLAVLLAGGVAGAKEIECLIKCTPQATD